MKFRNPKRSATILIVDDDRTVIDTLSTVLDIRGFHILEADTGNKAMDLINRYKPDLILLDLMLPGVNGLDIFNKIKSNKHLSHIPILIITAITDGSTLSDNFWKEGTQADGFITKPFDPFQLADMVESLLNLDKSEMSS